MTPANAPLPPGVPADPFAGIAPRAAVVGARRELPLLGARAELLWLPERAQRPGVPVRGQPPFRSASAERIVAEETVWRAGGLSCTPNRYPFAERQALLWAATPVRELTAEMLALALALEDHAAGTVLLNTVGAAASLPRAHVHLVGERLPFLQQLPQRETPPPSWLPALRDVAVLRLDPPFPALAVGLRGPAAARAAAAARLLELRAAPAVNLVSSSGVTWLFPRSGVEIPAPHFPHALGAAELWGRWCYAQREAFERATESDLLAALREGCWPQ
jgi:hypothetical protein